jgi:hypothetical protein
MDPRRLQLARQSLEILRALSGRILGQGLLPGPTIQDALIEVRDILEELSSERAGFPPPDTIVRGSQRLLRLAEDTGFFSDYQNQLTLSGQQKIVLGDMMVYLEKARDLLDLPQDIPLHFAVARKYLHSVLDSIIVLLTDFLDPDLFEPYDLSDMIRSLVEILPATEEYTRESHSSTSAPVFSPLKPETAPPRVEDAIRQAMQQENIGWKIDDDGLLKPVEEDASENLNLANLLGNEVSDDEAWSQIWVEETESVPGGQHQSIAQAQAYSEELQSLHSTEVHNLFLSIAKQFCQPLPSLLCNLQTKDLVEEHLEGIYGIVLNIHNSAEQFGHEELKHALKRLRKILETSQCDPARLSARDQIEILAEYDSLCVTFPGVFEPIGKLERGQRLRESIIIMEELRAIKGLGQRRITKLFAAGITNLRAFCEAQLEDFSAVSSIDRELAERILMVFRPYEILVAPFVGQEILDHYYKDQLDHLQAETRQLKEIHTLYARESKKPKFREQRQRLRELHRLREVAMGKIRCGLAVLEEFDLIDAMRKSRFDRRIQLLTAFLRGKDTALQDAKPIQALNEPPARPPTD